MTPREKRIQAAQRELISEAGGIEAAAAVLDLKKSQVGRMHADPPEAAMSVIQKSKLEAFVGRPIVTAAEAAVLGFDLVAIAESEPGPRCLNASIGVVAGELADLMKLYAELVADGLSGSDATLIDRELRDVARATEHARQACAAVQAKRKA